MRTPPSPLPVLVILSLVAAAPAHAGPYDCLLAAEDYVRRQIAKDDKIAQVYFVQMEIHGRGYTERGSGLCKSTCKYLFLSDDPTLLPYTDNDLPRSFRPMALDRALHPGGAPVRIRSRLNPSACKRLFYITLAEVASPAPPASPVEPAVVGTPSPAAAPAPSPTAPPPAGLTTVSAQGAEVRSDQLPTSVGDDPSTILGVYMAAGSGAVVEDDRGQAHSSTADIAAEAVQILGQIVVDRATQAAYKLISRKISEWLNCNICKENINNVLNPNCHFRAVCQVMGSLRLQDIAQASRVLGLALLQDLSLLVENELKSDPKARAGMRLLTQVSRRLLVQVVGGQTSFDAKEAALLVRDLVQEELASLSTMVSGTSLSSPRPSATPPAPVSRTTGPTKPASSSETAASTDGTSQTMVTTTRTQVRLCPEPGKEAGSQVIALAGTALLKCIVENEAESKGLQRCPVITHVDRIAAAACSKSQFSPAQLSQARRLAVSFLAGLSDSSPRQRLANTLDAAFEAMCLKIEGCELVLPQPGSRPTVGGSLALLRRGILAVLDQDTNTLVVVAIQGLEYWLSSKLQGEASVAARRALRIVASLLQYAETYTSGSSSGASEADKAKSVQAMHERRTKILESLTQDMTSREGRNGDWIVGLGGTLRVTGGARFGLGEAKSHYSYLGPLGLQLGLGVQKVNQTNDGGLLLELNVLDLGQYLSFTEGGEVETPEFQYAFSPTLAVGYFWGTDVPVVLSAHVGITPYFVFAEADDSTEEVAGFSFNLGASLGMYVPLLDFN